MASLQLVKMDRFEYKRGLYGENPKGTPQKMHGKTNSGFDNNRTTNLMNSYASTSRKM
jgi:hypothetical protein